MKKNTKTAIIVLTTFGIGTIIVLALSKKGKPEHIYLDDQGYVHGISQNLIGSGGDFIRIEKYLVLQEPKLSWEYWDQIENNLLRAYLSVSRVNNQVWLDGMVEVGRLTQDQVNRGYQQIVLVYDAMGW